MEGPRSTGLQRSGALVFLGATERADFSLREEVRLVDLIEQVLSSGIWSWC